MYELDNKSTRLVTYTMKKFQNIPPEEYEDYYQEGCLALVKAAYTYDESKGYTFSTLACECIENKMKALLRKRHHPTVSLEEPIPYSYVGADKILTYEDVLVGDEDVPLPYEHVDILSLVPTDWKHSDMCYEYISDFLRGLNRPQSYYSDKYHISQTHVSRTIKRLYETLKIRLKKEGYVWNLH